MTRVEVLIVGKELLIGRTLNTNGHWIGRRLALMGSMVARMTTVDDDLKEIASGLNEALAREPDFLVSVGGLGPTPDDMTLKGLADGLGVPLRLSAAAVAMMKESYVRRQRVFEMTPARRKMAVLPVGAEPVPNVVGTAPGVRILKWGTVIFCLPGVPKEMKSIFRGSVEPEIRASLGELHRRVIRLKISGVFESVLAPFIRQELDRYPGTYIKSHPKGLMHGVSRVELDIVSVKRRKQDADSTAVSVASEMVEVVKRQGGEILASQGMQGR